MQEIRLAIMVFSGSLIGYYAPPWVVFTLMGCGAVALAVMGWMVWQLSKDEEK